MHTKYHRVTGWGEALYLEMRFAGGLNPIVRSVQAAVGKGIGVRNTFAKLYELSDPPTEDSDCYRAWLLLTAIGQDPADWGVSDDALPPAIDRATVSDLLERQMRWFPGCHPIAA